VRDFSGEYILNRPASTLSPGADQVRTSVMRIKHNEPTIYIEASFEFADGHKHEFSFERPTVWDGDAIISLDRTTVPNGEEIVMTWRYELQDEGRTLKASEQLKRREFPQDNIWIFERQ
jgi:hypothetical protein